MGSAVWTGELPRYSADEVSRIKAALGAPVGRDAQVEDAIREIQNAADILSVSLLQREEQPDTQSVEGDMRRDAKAIRGFLPFLDHLNHMDERTADVVVLWGIEERVPVWKLTELRRLIRSMRLDSLADRLEKGASGGVKGGRRALVEREWFVRQLAGIWERVHGKPPSKSHQSGPFLRFVVACLEPIAPDECMGIGGVIRKVTSK